MGVYYCTCCDTLHDGDYIPCAEHPDGSTDLICEEAAQEMAEQKTLNNTARQQDE